jgi:hypothetical protein
MTVKKVGYGFSHLVLMQSINVARQKAFRAKGRGIDPRRLNGLAFPPLPLVQSLH